MVALLGTVSGCASAPDAALERHEYRQVVMGVEARVVLHAPSEDRARAAAAAALARMNELDAVLSDWRADSELMRLCAQAGGAAVAVSRDLWTVLEAALEMAAETDGAFDPTVGPLTVLWRGARATGTTPSAADVAAARALVDWRRVEMDPAARAVHLAVAGMRLDLGAIGKGYACDAALEVLRSHGCPRSLVQLGGDIRAGEPPPGRSGWTVRMPSGAAISVADAGLSTSGDSEQHLDAGGRRHSHVLDARTGDALQGSGDVTALAPTALLSDALATACGILGPAAAQGLLARHPGARIVARAR